MREGTATTVRFSSYSTAPWEETEARVLVQDFRESCFLELEQRQGCAAELRSRLEQLYGVTLLPEAPDSTHSEEYYILD